MARNGTQGEWASGGGSAVSGLLRDAAYALRQLGRARGFTAAAIGTLALGIGATSAIFSLVWAVVLKPLPGVDPQRTVAVESLYEGHPGGVSAGNFVDWQARATQLERLAAVDGASFNLSEAGPPERVAAARVSSGFFEVFHTGSRLGRTFVASEDAPGQDRVVVLSEGLWRRRFGADPEVLGRAIRLGADSYTVVGVMPARFDPFLDHTQLWVPLALTPTQRAQHDEHFLQVVGTLKAGVTRERAQREMEALAAQLAKEYPNQNFERTARITPLGAFLVGDTAQQLFILLGAVLLVLVIACLNVGNLLLARGTARTRELAVRAALGAGARRIVRQLLTESVVLAVLGGAVGVALAAVLVQLLRAAAPADVPRLGEASLDGVVLAFALLVSLGSSLLFGVVPALRAARTICTGRSSARPQPRPAVGGTGSAEGSSSSRWRSPRRCWWARASWSGPPSTSARSSRGSPARAAQRATLAPPGRVRRARGGDCRIRPGGELPAGHAGRGSGRGGDLHPAQQLAVEQRPRPRGQDVRPREPHQLAPPGDDAGYLQAMGLKLLQGRFIDATDVAGSERVMVVSRALARAAFPARTRSASASTAARAAPSTSCGRRWWAWWTTCTPRGPRGASSRSSTCRSRRLRPSPGSGPSRR